MKSIDFEVSIRDIIRFLGVENFETKEAAIYELVKNSYDADSNNLKITISNKELIFEDDGIGMTEEDIRDKWMKIGQSHKRDNKTDTDRVYTGEKGIGRLALARLGNSCEMYSQTNNSRVHWKSNWDKNEIETDNIIGTKGTKIVVAELNDNWTSTDITKLKVYLVKSIKSDKLKIEIIDKVSKIEEEVITESIKNVFTNLEPNLNYFLDFEFSVNNNIIYINVNNKLFSKEIMKELKLEEKYSMRIEEGTKFEYLNGVSGHFYYGFKIDSEAKEKFSYRPEKTDYQVPQIYKNKLDGIILYRNDFSVQGYDGGKDWANLQKRQNTHNKAISDSTGKTAFRKNNIFGYIEVDKYEHSKLKDLSNRQGLVQNEELELLIRLVDTVFGNVEMDLKTRFYIPIRKYTKDKVDNSFSDEQNLRINLNKELKKFKKLTQEQKEKQYKEKEEKRFTYEYINKIEEKNEELKKDTFALETYSTQSLLINSVTHDLKNNLSVVGNNPRYIRDLLVHYGYEDDLIKNTCDNISYKNYKNLMDGLQADGEDLELHLTRLLNGIKREKFNIKEINIEDYLEKIIEYFNKAFSNINIEAKNNITEDIKFYETTLDVIFNNLIDNSRKNNKDSEKVNIAIECSIIEKKLVINYKDDGVGLAEKYKKATDQIFLLGETTHEDSSGLGMWIINRRVKAHNGIIDIDSNHAGFKLTIELELK